MINSNIQELKIFYQTDAKRFLLPICYENLLNIISESFSIAKDNLNLNYIDGDGDKIIIGNELDYQHVLKICEKNSKNSLNLNLEKISSSNLTQSLMTIESKNEEEILENYEKKMNRRNEIMLDKLKISLKIEIEDKIEEFKNKIINIVESKLTFPCSTLPEENLNPIFPVENKEEKILNLYNESRTLKLSEQIEQISPELSNNNSNSNEIKLDKNSSEEKNIHPKNNSNKSDKSERSIFSLGLFSHDKGSKDNIVNFALVKNCRRCGDIINIEKNNFYFCLNCEDVFYCNFCYNEMEGKSKSENKSESDFLNKNEKSRDKLTQSNEKEKKKIDIKSFHLSFFRHILLKSTCNNLEHYESIKKFKNFQKIYNNKKKINDIGKKYFTQNAINNYYDSCQKASNNNALAFNILANKILIDIDASEFSTHARSSQNHIDGNYIFDIKEDFLNMKINIINLSSENIPRSSYFECIFDQSDIFGNKINVEETIQSFEEFELNISFYNFKNKPTGFYISQWRLKNNSQKIYSESLITFVFSICKRNEKFEVKEKRSESYDNIKREEAGLHYHHEINKNPNYCANKNTSYLNRFGISSLKIPDLYGEIIKKHQEGEREKDSQLKKDSFKI